jgi:hypothetical protein
VAVKVVSVEAAFDAGGSAAVDASVVVVAILAGVFEFC